MNRERYQTGGIIDNKGKFHEGTVFVGNINQKKMRLVRLENDGKSAVIEDMQTGRTFAYGLRALEMCSVTILEGD